MWSVCEILYVYIGVHGSHIPGYDAICTAKHILVCIVSYPIMRKSLSIIAFSYVISLPFFKTRYFV